MPQPLDEGTVARLRATTAPAAVPWVEAAVRGCQPMTGRWLLHCRYTTPPAREAVLFFK